MSGIWQRRTPAQILSVVLAVGLLACSTPRPIVRAGDDVLIPLSEIPDPGVIHISPEEFERAMQANIKAILATYGRGQAGSPVARQDQDGRDEALVRCLAECPDEAAFTAALARAGQVDPGQLEVAFADLRREAMRARLASWRPAGPLEQEYAAWCVQRGEPGDCLGLGQMDEMGRKRVALSVAFSAVWAGAVHGMKETVNPRTVELILLAGMLTYLAMIVVPEPITKAAAAALTIVLVSYLGIGTVWRIISEYKALSQATKEATEFSQIRKAGERFGFAMGDTSARVFVMLVSVAIGQTAGLVGKATGFLNKVPTLPGYGMAVAGAPSRAGIPLSMAAELESVMIADGALTVAVAPAAVVAVARSPTTSSLRFNFGFRSYSSFRYWHGPAGPGKEWHHIVEQTEANVAKFGAERVHNKSNVVALDKAIHDKITALYSSKAERWTSSTTLTVRQWLSTQSFEAQRQFGERILSIVQAGATP